MPVKADVTSHTALLRRSRITALPSVVIQAVSVAVPVLIVVISLMLLLAFQAVSEGYAASRSKSYGTPLRFEPPPVDLEHNTDGADDTQENVEDNAPQPGVEYARPQNAPPSRSETPEPPRSQVQEQQTQVGGFSAVAAPLRLFGTVEFRSPLKNIPKWERVYNLERKRPTFGGNEQSTMTKDVAARWGRLRGSIQGASLIEQAKAVNNFFNQWPYKTDLEVWGVEDYWETPGEFVKRSGDCEDYAISKYYALRDLGVPARNLRVLALRDTIRNLGHAVLVVYVDGNAYILDNLTNLVLSHTRLSHYAPQFSVNEEYLWRHIKPKSGPTR